MQASRIDPEQFEEIVDLAVPWVEAQEQRILRVGMTLTPDQVCDARAMGVEHPEKVRLLPVIAISRPEQPLLKAAAEAVNLISPFTRGLTLRYGVYIRADELADRFLIAHELAHVAQYERLGGIRPFLWQYLHECLTIGYHASPMEQEAVRKAESLRG